jgi:hypothetical protein
MNKKIKYVRKGLQLKLFWIWRWWRRAWPEIYVQLTSRELLCQHGFQSVWLIDLENERRLVNLQKKIIAKKRANRRKRLGM